MYDEKYMKCARTGESDIIFIVRLWLQLLYIRNNVIFVIEYHLEATIGNILS